MTDGTRGPSPMRPETIGGGMTDGTRGPSPMRSETQMFRDGGEVRGCKSSQMTGKGFSGSY